MTNEKFNGYVADIMNNFGMGLIDECDMFSGVAQAMCECDMEGADDYMQKVGELNYNLRIIGMAVLAENNVYDMDAVLKDANTLLADLRAITADIVE